MNGANDLDFILWTRIHNSGMVKGATLAGEEKFAMNAERLKQQNEPYCFKDNVKILAASKAHGGPKHMRSDVDRVVFGRDMDSSEMAVRKQGDTEESYSWNQNRLESQVHSAATTKQTTAADAAADAEEKKRRAAAPSLNLEDFAYMKSAFEGLSVTSPRAEVAQRRLGASRPTMVNPHGRSGNRQQLLQQMKANPSPAYLEELAKWEALRMKAAVRPKVVRGAVADAVSPRRWGA